MDTETATPLWSLVAALERRTLEHWRKANFTHKGLEEAYATEVRSLETTVKRASGTSTLVTICVIARQGHKSDLEVFTLQNAGKGVWKVLKGTLD
jgi:hypothetical protein